MNAVGYIGKATRGPSPYEALCRVIEKFRWAVVSLSYTPTSAQLEKWSMYVLDGMSGPARFYHSPDHVLELSEKLDPIATIAALYHDLVYYQVDGGVAPFIHSLIFPYFNSVNGILYIRELEPGDYVYDISLEVFGYGPGQQLLVNKGQNEFLSTLFALKVMSGVLSKVEILEVAMCIEATIPFRADTGAMALLEERAVRANKRFSLGMDEKDIAIAMARAVVLSNKDVENFSYSDAGLFLEQTWRLLPETNARLNTSSTYSIREYRIALYKMESFLSNLKAEVIYHRYKETPDEEEYNQLVQTSRKNLKIAVFYLRLNMYSMAILEALADLTGGDAPLVYFVGSPGSATGKSQGMAISQFLSDFIPEVQAGDHDPVIEKILSDGISDGAAIDAKSSPVSSYLYRNMGEKAVVEGCIQAKDMFIGKLSSQEFLVMQNPVLTEEIIKACSHLALTRKRRLWSLLDLLGISESASGIRLRQEG